MLNQLRSLLIPFNIKVDTLITSLKGTLPITIRDTESRDMVWLSDGEIIREGTPVETKSIEVRDWPNLVHFRPTVTRGHHITRESAFDGIALPFARNVARPSIAGFKPNASAKQDFHAREFPFPVGYRPRTLISVLVMRVFHKHACGAAYGQQHAGRPARLKAGLDMFKMSWLFLSAIALETGTPG